MQHRTFYEEHASRMDRFDKLQIIIDAVKGDVKDAIAQEQDNTTISHTKTFVNIPIQSMETRYVVFDISKTLEDFKISERFGFGGKRVPLSKRVEKWKNAHWREKIPLLFYTEKYVEITYEGNRASLVNVDVYTPDGKELQRNIDYTFVDGRLYFLDNDHSFLYDYDTLFLKNIIIDSGNAEKKLMQFMPFEYQETFSRPQYSLMLKSFIRTAATGSYMDALNASLEAFEPEEYQNGSIHVYDFYSATESQRDKYWQHDGDRWKPALGSYSVFDAVIELPPEYMKDLSSDTPGETRLEYLTRFLEMVKPAHTRIHPTIQYLISEILDISQADREKIRVKTKKYDDPVSILDGDQFLSTIHAKITDKIIPFEYSEAIYDVRTKYSFGQFYDAYRSLYDGLQDLTINNVALADQVTITILDGKQ